MTDELEELSARARRERLSETDAKELTRELASSEDARLWHRAGLAFDAEDIVLPGDAAATERVLARLLGEIPAKKPKWRNRSALLLVAAAVLVASVAAAAVLELAVVKRPAPVTSALPPQPSARTTASAIPNRTPTAMPVPEEPPLAPIPSTSASAETPTPSASSASSAPAPLSASELMSAAGRARRQGHSGQAIQLLNQLQARFPGSPEANASDVSLGMLELKNGSTTSARAHFDRYLSRTPQGSLAPDALWGKSQTQFAAGDGNGARKTLHALLAQFPTSAYSSAAQAKLDTP